MGAPTGIDVEAMRAENEQLRKEREELRSTVEELNSRVRALKYKYSFLDVRSLFAHYVAAVLSVFSSKKRLRSKKDSLNSADVSCCPFRLIA
jgi:predicted nuclease with TOPRIM domain